MKKVKHNFFLLFYINILIKEILPMFKNKIIIKANRISWNDN